MRVVAGILFSFRVAALRHTDLSVLSGIITEPLAHSRLGVLDALDMKGGAPY